MIVTVFRNRLTPDHQAEYFDTAKRMAEIARSMPGYISHKSFAADDGERVTIVEFADEASQQAWATETRHLAAKARGREAFYSGIIGDRYGFRSRRFLSHAREGNPYLSPIMCASMTKYSSNAARFIRRRRLRGARKAVAPNWPRSGLYLAPERD